MVSRKLWKFPSDLDTLRKSGILEPLHCSDFRHVHMRLLSLISGIQMGLGVLYQHTQFQVEWRMHVPQAVAQLSSVRIALALELPSLPHRLSRV